MISHDREFLDAVTQVTVHVDNAKLVRYGGNYSKFEDMRAEQLVLQQAAMAKQAEKSPCRNSSTASRPRLRRRSRRRAGSRRSNAWRDRSGACRRRVQLRVQGATQRPEPAVVDAGRELRLPGADRRSAGHPPTVIVRGINRSVLAGQRIGILGANGQGKSTLVKTVAHALAPISGEISEGKGLNIGYFAQQELDVLRPLDTPMEHMNRLAKDTPAHMRAPARVAPNNPFAPSSAPSTSAATWSIRRLAR